VVPVMRDKQLGGWAEEGGYMQCVSEIYTATFGAYSTHKIKEKILCEYGRMDPLYSRYGPFLI
jgi:hypothetical protein